MIKSMFYRGLFAIPIGVGIFLTMAWAFDVRPTAGEVVVVVVTMWTLHVVGDFVDIYRDLNK